MKTKSIVKEKKDKYVVVVEGIADMGFNHIRNLLEEYDHVTDVTCQCLTDTSPDWKEAVLDLNNKAPEKQDPFEFDVEITITSKKNIAKNDVVNKLNNMLNLDTVPPKNQTTFHVQGITHHINPEYKDELYASASYYTIEEIMGSYLGYNPYFPSYESWVEARKEVSLD
jgi:hypothetical protein